MSERNSERAEQPGADVRVHLTTGHKTIGDALFAAADAAKRAAPSAASGMREVARVASAAIVVLVVLAVVLVGGVLLYEHYESRERRAKQDQEAAAEARAEAERVSKRRAVLDLLDPGRVAMLCPIAGEVIGRQLVEMGQLAARNAIGPCSAFGTECRPFTSGCTPATRVEADAWRRAFESAPVAQRLDIARRAVVGADPSPRITFVDAETGELYTVNRSEFPAALRTTASYLPATPKQIAAWVAVSDGGPPLSR